MIRRKYTFGTKKTNRNKEVSSIFYLNDLKDEKSLTKSKSIIPQANNIKIEKETIAKKNLTCDTKKKSKNSYKKSTLDNNTKRKKQIIDDEEADPTIINNIKVDTSLNKSNNKIINTLSKKDKVKTKVSHEELKKIIEIFGKDKYLNKIHFFNHHINSLSFIYPNSTNKEKLQILIDYLNKEEVNILNIDNASYIKKTNNNSKSNDKSKHKKDIDNTENEKENIVESKFNIKKKANLSKKKKKN